ncbi:MAG: helix-turn-helix domain-containing protein, partial [Streptosporangiaceae bacterium]
MTQVASEHLGESLGTDFFSVREQFTDEQWEHFITVRRFVDEEVVPVVGAADLAAPDRPGRGAGSGGGRGVRAPAGAARHAAARAAARLPGRARVVCWVGDAAAAVDEINRLERAVSHVAVQAACSGDPVFLPRDESSAWAWLPLGFRDTFDSAAVGSASVDADIHFAFGDAAKGTTGFRLTHQQATAVQAVAQARGSAAPQAVLFRQVAPVAIMLASDELLRPWVFGTLADLATDDEHHARLRETLLVFLQSGGSYKSTAEQLMLHKNTVQYRIRKAEESLGQPVGDRRHDVELALLAGHWLGPAVLRPAAAGYDRDSRPGTR